MMDDYKSWRIHLESKPAPDVPGRWRAYVTVEAAQGGSLREVPLLFKDGRTFATRNEADAAGTELAKVWIDTTG